MTEMQKTHTPAALLAAIEAAQQQSTGNPWLDALRLRGAQRFRALGLPSTRVEAWRQTNLAALAKAELRTAEAPATPPAEAALAPYRLGPQSGPEVVFHNGRLASISGTETLPTGVKLLSLATAARTEQSSIEPHLGALVDLESDALAALNTAFLGEGAVLLIPRGVVLEQPVHVLFLTSGAALHAHPRLLVLAEENSQATLLETWCTNAPESVYFNNPLTEIVLGAGARIEHIKQLFESDAAFHIGGVQYRQDRDSHLASFMLTLNGGLVRHDLGSWLAGPGAHSDLNGLYLLHGTQHCDNHTRLDHAVPNCTSHELYKGVLDGNASGVFTGRIHVHPDAQKTDAIQANRALLLSDTATINSQPQLEIYADDVKCTHGATVGQLSDTMEFYLRSRGINRAAARGILTYAFAGEIVERISLAAVRQRLEDVLAERLHIQAQPVRGQA